MALTDRESARRRSVGAISAWLGTSTWPADCAAGITAAYGMLKAYWVFGGSALWSIAPLDPEMIERARSGTAPRWFEIADVVSVVLALAGVFFALATVRPRRWLPIWLVRWSLWPLAAFMVLRAVLSMPGDAYEIASGGALTHTAMWDLFLWSPLFLIWGLPLGSNCDDLRPTGPTGGLTSARRCSVKGAPGPGSCVPRPPRFPLGAEWLDRVAGPGNMLALSRRTGP